MGLRISIDHKKLSDSPYCEANKSVFNFTASDTDDLAQDIVNGNPTCYLISGYRGAGKTSFIKKLESDIRDKSKKSLFIHLGFAKHEPRTILLRKLIRNFYLQLISKENKILFDELEKVENLKEPLVQFKELYERTFFEVSKNTNVKKAIKTSSTLELNANFKDVGIKLAPFILMAGSLGGLNFDQVQWGHYIILGASVIWAFAQFFDFGKKRESENVNESQNSKNSFYDDEIAEYYLIEVLQIFQQHMQPIFVLDELDKITEDSLVYNLINELKPLMLSGLASFIVVAGQNLTYSYYESHTKDDSPLSSLFSKVHHISLFSASELRLLFRKMMRYDPNNLSQDETLLLEAYLNYLIFESKLIPRRFISLIRQNLIWNNNESYIEINRTLKDLGVYNKILSNIEKIQNDVILPEGYPEPIRDYFNMQLLIKAQLIISGQSDFIDESKILTNNGK